MGRRTDPLQCAPVDSSSSDNSSDEPDECNAEPEGDSFRDTARRKKRKVGHDSEQHIYGVFGEDSDGERSGLGRHNIRYRYAIRPTDPFAEQARNVNFVQQGENEHSDEDERPSFAHSYLLGKPKSENSASPAGLGAAPTNSIPSASLTAAHGGLRFNHSISNEESVDSELFSMQATPGGKTAFTAAQPSTTSQKRRAPAKAPPKAEFNTVGFGARMMAKMGYVSGTGLGQQGQGIVNPIETKLRPGRLGLGGIKEKTEQAKEEARRRGKIDSSDDEEKKKAKKKALSSGTRTKKVKYRTVREIIQDSKGLHVPLTLERLIDMTGKETKLITAASGVLTTSQIEHNESLKIANMARRDVEAFASEWKQLQDRKSYVKMEESRIAAELEQDETEINKLNELLELIEELNIVNGEAEDALVEISPLLEQLQFKFQNESENWKLDEVTVAAILPYVKQILKNWEPTEESCQLTHHFHRWKLLLQILNKADHEDSLAKASVPKKPVQSTTYYESLIYSLWLPKVRTAINNDWDPHDPSSLLSLLDAWIPLLPAFIHDSILDNLILPKLHRTVNDWNPRTHRTRKGGAPPPHSWVFPWLPYLGDRMEEVVDDVKRKFGHILGSWNMENGVVEGLDEWKAIFGESALDELLRKHLLSKLAAVLRSDFEINPADQVLEPLSLVLLWKKFFLAKTFGRLFEVEFFPKWLNILYLWLTAQPNYEEVMQWYQFWKGMFTRDLGDGIEAVDRGFRRGLDMINEALILGDEAGEKLQPPSSLVSSESAHTKPKPPRPKVDEEITFKDVVEEFCAEHNLLLVPMRQPHKATGFPLFRITASASGTGGVLCYLHEDVIWAQLERDRFSPAALEEVLKRAEKS
ncbi:G-patch domain-containing protein [Neolecta irregularis DAH-3]|uniref:G-patch domain-containing protein n=1 Tax=Neolecta irregularis (strain DAH-3) TaxID=1198029 RepID=A0A1U7LP25_NEOID|nr:G-patch domain-containing protein [Neolecta irregularis DAH-3]|eukprot:OLL24416.1 G-patch domain-containing protein [Neolecta irregularis DAH-3]